MLTIYKTVEKILLRVYNMLFTLGLCDYIDYAINRLQH